VKTDKFCVNDSVAVPYFRQANARRSSATLFTIQVPNNMNTSFQAAFEQVKTLVADFKANELAYLEPAYSEAQVRQDFIDKFFTALGWDVAHTAQKNPYEQEVKIENRVSMQGSQRRADYAFFLAPNFRDVKFLVEAKKPSRNLKNADDYFQTICYSWNRNAPVAVLTDFKELHILDARFKPSIAHALERGIKVFHYSDYLNEETFAEIYFLFSREAVANNSLEKFAESLPKPKGIKKSALKDGYQKVDEAFLETLDEWRETLAKNFKAKNPALNGEALTEAVQRTLDRLVFTRFLEDKQIEEPMVEHFGNKGDSWKAFRAHCRELEPKYNGLVFKPHPIIDREDFVPPDEKVFSDICKELSGSESPYNFAEIPIAILGSIYERFLGKVVSVSEKRAKVIEKPEVRKAGGVYYTPEYIVRYIVAETVGKLIEGKTPDEISNMAFADIACGSGSFLIEVYDCLIKYHERYYLQHPDKIKKGDTEIRNGELKLSLKKRREILINNIFGYDIDYQAIEVTELSLYLKLLEDATTNDAYQFSLLKEKILPDLNRNIICGNALIETDILDNSLFEPEAERKLNPMNFEDAFPRMMKRGGFDAIVGNPPYVRAALIDEPVKQYLSKHYDVAVGQFDLYTVFIDRALSLIKAKGYLGYIVPRFLMFNLDSQRLREKLLSLHVEKIVEAGKAFKNVDTEACILTVKKESVDGYKIQIYQRDNEKFSFVQSIYPKVFKTLPNKIFNVRLTQQSFRVLQKILHAGNSLKEVARIKRGMEIGKSTIRSTKNGVPVLIGEDTNRYHIAYQGTVAPPNHKEVKRLSHEHRSEKILIRRVAPTLIAALDSRKLLFTKNLYSVISEDVSMKYLMALINSKVLQFFFKSYFTTKKEDIFPEIQVYQLEQLPIPVRDLSEPSEKAVHDRIVKLVEQMMSVKERYAAAKSEQEQLRLERLAAGLDRQIDEAVYALYGLTEEEIALVEG
jgi:adenine-specific DNA-methyltransferase